MSLKLILTACAVLFSAAACAASPAATHNPSPTAPASSAYNAAAYSPLTCAPHTTFLGTRDGYDCKLRGTTATLALQNLQGQQWCNAGTSMCKGIGNALLSPQSPGMLAALPSGSTVRIALECKSPADHTAPWFCEVAWVAESKGGAK